MKYVRVVAPKAKPDDDYDALYNFFVYFDRRIGFEFRSIFKMQTWAEYATVDSNKKMVSMFAYWIESDDVEPQNEAILKTLKADLKLKMKNWSNKKHSEIKKWYPIVLKEPPIPIESDESSDSESNDYEQMPELEEI